MFPQYLQTQIKIQIWPEGEKTNINPFGSKVMNLGKWLLKKLVRNRTFECNTISDNKIFYLGF